MDKFNEWFNNLHPLIQVAIMAPIGGAIGGFVGLFIWYNILGN